MKHQGIIKPVDHCARERERGVILRRGRNCPFDLRRQLPVRKLASMSSTRAEIFA